ncbi:MAG: allantoinase PuuE [Zavarzinia sp.]|nr:allantoinase PuuE [Zavarzinia sp.]
MTWHPPRDLIGYGNTPPKANWPGGARIAIQIVLNYEEGGENSIENGDAASEAFLSEVVNAQPLPGVRHLSVESIFDYGARVGSWRLLKLFHEQKVPVTVFAVARAAEKHPDLIRAMVDGGHEIACHGLRWINYQYVGEAAERAHVAEAVEILSHVAGTRPVGWYTGRTGPHTRRLVAGHGGFLYDADAYDDDLPYWQDVAGKPLLIVPYTLDANDMRFINAQGFGDGRQFFAYLKDSFDTLYAEGGETPRMLSIGLHCRLAGRPGRFAAVKNFIDYAKSHEGVWFARRDEIARHWHLNHPAPGA